MRKYDIPYVRRGPADYKPVIPLEKMTITQIKDSFIRTCAKASGRFSVCEKCESKCKEGKYALDLMNGKIKPEEPIPLYGGKTMLQKAQEENAKRRERLEAEANGEKAKKEYVRYDGWWEESLKSGDQIQWLMTNLGLSKAKAKQRIYQYKWAHGMTKEKTQEVSVNLDPNIETTLDRLMKQQEEYQKKIDEFTRLRDDCKTKIDILCQAMDIIGKEDA